MKIVSWNVNSVRSRLEHVTSYLKEVSPDVLLLQELKCQTDAFPYEAIEDLGYNVKVHGQKTYNGVAILSKHPVDDVVTELPGDKDDDHARYIEAVVSAGDLVVRVASVYVPNGQSPDSDKFQYKLKFFDRLYEHLKELLTYEEVMVIGGDYNVAPSAIDVYDPKGLEGTTCFHPLERQKFRALIGLGLLDAYRAVNPETQEFSWWDYRGGAFSHGKGMRIDHLLLSPEAADLCLGADVDLEPRKLEKPSDHAPVWCEVGG